MCNKVTMEENRYYRNEIEYVDLISQEGHTFHYICRAGNMNKLVDIAPIVIRNRDLLIQYDHEGKNSVMNIELLATLGADINS